MILALEGAVFLNTALLSNPSNDSSIDSKSIQEDIKTKKNSQSITDPKPISTVTESINQNAKQINSEIKVKSESVNQNKKQDLNQDLNQPQTQAKANTKTKVKHLTDRNSLNQKLLLHIQDEFQLSSESMDSLSTVFKKSPVISQGNPQVTKHPVTTKQCQDFLKIAGISYENKKYESICKHKYMAPLYDPQKQKMEEASVCIDQFEFPSIPCEYPLVWTRADEAVAICEAMGKRLCDAHEWEGACEGRLTPPDYKFEKNLSSKDIQRLRLTHNNTAKKTYSYGGQSYKNGVCAAASFKSKDCNGGDWKKCGSNTYPAGYFPNCKSSLDVWDLHGNAAEHMNLPLKPEQMASQGQYGYTEMKGSWFIFDTYKAHPDWCRWRAPFWHGTRVKDPRSHHNYHLGFRCCYDIKTNKEKG